MSVSRMAKLAAWIFGLALTLTSLGCNSAASRPVTQSVPVEFVYAGSFCGGGTVESMAPIANQAELQTALQRGSRVQLGRTLIPPRPDFSRGPVWLLEMGSMPTAGHALELAADQAELLESVLTVKVNWRRPGSEQLVAQVITYPCLVFQVLNADFRALRVVDQAGVERAVHVLR